MTKTLDTFETDQPWVLYHYGATHDRWWPFWSSTRVTGRAIIEATCMVCGDRTPIKFRIPRFGEIPNAGKHPKRVEYLREHEHTDRGAPMSWAIPLANIAAHPNGLNLDALAMRLEADINERNNE